VMVANLARDSFPGLRWSFTLPSTRNLVQSLNHNIATAYACLISQAAFSYMLKTVNLECTGRQRQLHEREQETR
jgi:hypothetical protein